MFNYIDTSDKCYKTFWCNYTIISVTLVKNTRNYTDSGIICAKKIYTRDQFHQHFCHQSRTAFAQIIINTFSGNKIWQNCTKIRCPSAKAVAWDIQDNFSANVGKTEQHLLRHFTLLSHLRHCTSWLVKWTPGAYFYFTNLDWNN